MLPLAAPNVFSAMRRVLGAFDASPVKEDWRPVRILGRETLLPSDSEEGLRIFLVASSQPASKAQSLQEVEKRVPWGFSWILDLIATLPFERNNETFLGWKWTEAQRAFFLAAFADAFDASMSLIEVGGLGTDLMDSWAGGTSAGGGRGRA